MSSPRVLIVEDEINLAEGIKENLEEEGYQVELAADGATGLARMREPGLDLVLLDVMLPELDGFAVCETARKEGLDTPILFLTAKSSADDRIRGLELGGDDYLSKPFNLSELLLRVAAILRRRGWYGQTPRAGSVVRFGENEFDFDASCGRSWDGAEQKLPEKEAMILKALVEQEGEVVTREEILDKVWGYDVYPSTRAIDTLVERLKKRFERRPDAPEYLHTVRGVGYRFTRDGDTDS